MLTLEHAVKSFASVRTRPTIHPKDLLFYVPTELYLIKVISLELHDVKTKPFFFKLNFSFHPLEYFVCDWYMNVKCENSENFYKLNDLIGQTMEGLPSSKNDLMNSAREIIMFPQQGQKPGSDNKGNGNIYTDYPSDLGSPLGINTGGGGGGGGVGPTRGSSNLGQPTAGQPNSGPQNNNNNPYSPGQAGTNGANGPQRGSNGGTVYVNSLGQLSTDTDSGFDPKHSFILKPDKDSNFDQDIRIPSNSFDTLKGIGNSYSFGFPDQNNAPIRGSEDLSLPVDPSAFGKEQYLPPHLAGGPNRKQLYTYPHEAQSNGQNNLQGILPEYTGQLNMKLAAQGPTYQAPQVYGPTVLQPQNGFQQPSNQSPVNQNRLQPQSGGPSRFQPQQGASGGPSPSRSQQGPSQQPQRLYQQPHQTVKSSGNFQQPGNQQKSPAVRLYQQPQKSQHQQQQQQHQQKQFQPSSQQPQPFKASNQNPQLERRQFNVPQNNGQQPNRNSFHNGNNNNGFSRHHQQPQQQQQQHHQQQSNGPKNGVNKQSNEDYLRALLKDKTHIHHDKVQLVELIQRFFVPASAQSRVVSADVIPSQAAESYSFTYDGQEAASNTKSNYQPAHSGYHQHTGTCGHTRQGY